MVQWTSVTAKTGKMHYSNKSGAPAKSGTLDQCTFKIWYNGLAYLENMVQWTSVPGNTGTIHYCTNTNK